MQIIQPVVSCFKPKDYSLVFLGVLSGSRTLAKHNTHNTTTTTSGKQPNNDDRPRQACLASVCPTAANGATVVHEQRDYGGVDVGNRRKETWLRQGLSK